MFDNIASLLPTPTSLASAPRKIASGELSRLRREALRRALQYFETTRPEEYGVHPLGFLNIPLFESRSHRIRIHIWDRSIFVATSPYKIHDHSYSSYSIVLAGDLRNIIYREATPESDHAGYSIAVATPGATTTSLQLTTDRVQVEPVAELDLVPGAAYGLGRNVFHHAYTVSGFAITLYFHLRHLDSLGVSRVAIPIRDRAGGRQGRFEYELMSPQNLIALEQTVRQALD